MDSELRVMLLRSMDGIGEFETSRPFNRVFGNPFAGMKSLNLYRHVEPSFCEFVGSPL
ncbi:MAG: hypothetical protein NT133_18855 [Alphaproteobacteria bacterium]|nr:hypothetical protein [Alphaproteobacteria bacterium]